MLYKKGFWISSEKEITPYFFFEENNNNISYMNILNEINMISTYKNQIRLLIDNIISVKNSNSIEYETSSNMVTFKIEQDNVTITNYLFDLPSIVISTNSFLQLIEEKDKFINDLSEINIFIKIKNALFNIKKNPLWGKGKGYSFIDNENVFYMFSINQSEINTIDIEEYINATQFIKLD